MATTAAAPGVKTYKNRTRTEFVAGALPGLPAQHVLAVPAYSLRDKLMGEPPPTSTSAACTRQALFDAHDRSIKATVTTGANPGRDGNAPPADDRRPSAVTGERTWPKGGPG